MSTAAETELQRINAVSEELPEAQLEDAQPRVIQHRYRVEERLGRGPFAEVYRARQLRLDRMVALKILSSKNGATQQMQERFVREARILAQLNHPNIVAVYDYGETEEGSPYVVMEYLSGSRLLDVIAGPALEDRRAVAIAFQIASALLALHRAGLAHPELKPSNIVLLDGTHETGAGAVKLLGFGVSEYFGRGMPNGTAQFIAPERFDGAAADARADVYSFGVLLYALVAGQAPFQGKTVEELADQHRYAPLPPLVEVGHRRAPAPAIGGLIERCLAKAPDDRYASIAQVQEALQRCLVTIPGSLAVLEELYDLPLTLPPYPPDPSSTGASLDDTYEDAWPEVQTRVMVPPEELPKRRWPVALVLLILVISGMTWWWWSLLNPRSSVEVFELRSPSPPVAPAASVMNPSPEPVSPEPVGKTVVEPMKAWERKLPLSKARRVPEQTGPIERKTEGPATSDPSRERRESSARLQPKPERFERSAKAIGAKKEPPKPAVPYLDDGDALSVD